MFSETLYKRRVMAYDLTPPIPHTLLMETRKDKKKKEANYSERFL